MSYIDIALVLMVVVGIFSGYKEGFLMTLFSLIAIVLGVLGGFKLMGWAMIYLANEFNVDEKVLPYIAFGAVFVGIVLLVNLLGRMIKASIDQTFLGRADQVAGALLGAVKTVFIVSVALWLMESMKFKFPEKWTEKSVIYPYVSEFAPTVTSWIGEIVPAFKDIF
ncbi:MAG: CvpA family protein [Bacteroidota bacterium]